MGWHDDEEANWIPDWAVQPIMWLGCLMVSVLPAGVLMQVVRFAWSKPPAPVTLGVYLVALGLMLAAVKPWSVR
ncbi:MAG: hypothetical protein PSX79_14640 [bacterium]|nr:hypothetical protein [bacterium]